MAAAEYTVVNLIDEGKSHVNDVAGVLGAAGEFDGLGGSASDDLKYDSLLMEALRLTGETTLTLQKQTTGLYAYTPGRTGLWLADRTTPFTGEDDVKYRVYEWGPRVMVTSGTHSEDTIQLKGTLVDFPDFMAKLFYWLADTKATQIPFAAAGEDFNPDAVRDSLIIQAAYWQGVTTSAT